MLMLMLLALAIACCSGFAPAQRGVVVLSKIRGPQERPPFYLHQERTDNIDGGDEMSLEDLKVELTAYLAKRKEMNADELAKSEVGKVIGGTKGNKVLEYVSGAPNKAQIVEEVPDIFDYGELAKYGYSSLVTPIMDNGGRRALYPLMGLAIPVLPERLKPKIAQKLVIDRTGETDQGRYKGLKMNQVIDDEEMGRALAEAQQKTREGKRLKKRLEEEDYIQPFADKRNVSPLMTPEWTPEMLDEEGRKRGKAQAWARKARAGEYRRDPMERAGVEGSIRAYCIAWIMTAAFAFGGSSPTFLHTFCGLTDSASATILDVLHPIALVLIAASIGSGVVSSVVLAPPLNRSSFNWGLKGLAGGPLTILQLKSLEALKTRGENE